MTLELSLFGLFACLRNKLAVLHRCGFHYFFRASFRIGYFFDDRPHE